MSSARSSLTAVPTLSDVYLPNSDSDNSSSSLDLEKKSISPRPTHSLTFHKNNYRTDDLSTVRKTRSENFVTHLKAFKTKVSKSLVIIF
jgi:hypothetical protein